MMQMSFHSYIDIAAKGFVRNAYVSQNQAMQFYRCRSLETAGARQNVLHMQHSGVVKQFT